MSPWPKDTTPAKMEFYGDFRGKAWASTNLVYVKAPFQMFYDKQPLSRGVLCHKKISAALAMVFEEIWEKCHQDQHEIEKTGAHDYGGCFNIRKISGSNNWSNHSWACAIDLSPATNGFNTGHGTIGQIVVDAFKRQGFRWGGDYKGRKDPMHFEAVSP